MKISQLNRTIALVAALALLPGGCAVVADGDLLVRWTLDGTTEKSLCTSFGVARFKVIVTEIPEERTVDAFEFACGDHWDTGRAFYGISLGGYRVDVQALDAGGTVLAQKSTERTLPDSIDVYFVDLNLAASDFGGGSSKLNLRWVINGTVDGSLSGKSFDTCDEVGVSKVEVTVGTQTETFDCEKNGSMSGVFPGLDPGSYQASLVMTDSNGLPMTNALKVTATASANPAEALVDFSYGEFLSPWDNSTIGDFIFEVKFEGGACQSTNPHVELRVLMLDRDGTPVTGKEACPLGSTENCAALSSAGFAACVDGPQVIRGLPWGEYTMVLQGATGAPDICWELKDKIILVGAGTDNPQKDFDLPRISTSESCQPL